MLRFLAVIRKFVISQTLSNLRGVKNSYISCWQHASNNRSALYPSHLLFRFFIWCLYPYFLWCFMQATPASKHDESDFCKGTVLASLRDWPVRTCLCELHFLLSLLEKIYDTNKIILNKHRWGFRTQVRQICSFNYVFNVFDHMFSMDRLCLPA